MEAVLISGSPSATSRSRALLDRARARLEVAGWNATAIDLVSLPADALLGRREDAALSHALARVAGAAMVVAASPTYRATYTGLLKTFFDLLPANCLAGSIAVPILTGGGPGHQLALDHGFRPLFASLGATVVNGVYAHDAQFKNGTAAELLEQIDGVIDQAMALARGTLTRGS